MPFTYPDDVVEDDNGLSVDGAIQIDAFNNISRFGPQDPLSVLVNATDVFSVPVFLASAPTAGFTLQVNGTGDALIWAAVTGGGTNYQTIRDNGTPETQRPFLNVVSTTSIIAAAADDAGSTETELTWQRAALTGDITAAQDVNTTAFRTFSAKSVLANATNASGIPTELAGSAAFQHLRVNSANTGLEWAVLTVSAPITLTSNTIGFDQTANLDNNARIGVRKNTAGSTFLRRRLNLIEGTGVSLTVADDSGSEEVDVTVTATGISLSAIDDQRVLGNDSGSSAVPTAITVHQELDWIPGAGTRWVFDGSDDRADFGNINGFERTDSFSLGGWTAVTPAPGASHNLFSKFDVGLSRGFSIYLSATNKLGFFMTNSGVNTVQVETVAAIDGATHFLLATYDGTSAGAGVTLYVDGVSVSVTVIDTPITATIINTVGFTIGGLHDGSGSGFSGVLFETAAWNVKLNGTQALEAYNAGIPPDLNALATAPDPVFWAKFNDLDVVGANGIINYGTGGQPGTAEGGLAPTTSGVGSVPVRGGSTWGLINPGSDGLPLVSQGLSSIPAYEQLTLAALPSMATGTFLANITAGTAVPTAHSLTTFAGAGLTYTNVTGILAVGSSTSIIVGANDVQVAAYTGAITKAQNSTATAFGVLAAKSVLANATNASAVPAALAGSAAFQHLRVNSANNALEWAVLTVTSPITLTSDNIGFDQTVALGNNARIAVNKNSGATVGTRRRLNFIEGAGTTLTITDDAGNEEVDITISSAPAAGTVTPTMLSIFGTPTNTGVPFMIYVSYAAAAAGTPDDVTIFSASAPFNFRILEAWAVTATAIASSTVECRTATGGGGSALTTAMSTTVTGKTSDNSTVTTTVAASGSVFIRRSDRGVAGELFLLCFRT